MSEWQEHPEADTGVSARGATPQTDIFRLTLKGAVISTDRYVAFRCKPDGFLPEGSCRSIETPHVQYLSITDDMP
jgi:hypothetical protein